MLDEQRIDRKSVVEGAPIVLPESSPDFVFLRKDRPLIISEGQRKNISGPFGVSGSGTSDGGSNPTGPTGPENPSDIPQLTDIENITYVQYFNTSNLIRFKAIIKMRNSSKKKTSVSGVDARNEPNGGSSTGGGTPSGFITPAPTVPSVYFDRTGSAIAWGWNNSTNLGSYSSITYQWIVSTSSSATAAKLSSGTKSYVSNSSNLQIGDSGIYKDYRVSSAQGDTPATSSSRWLRVRTVVLGTDGKTYYSPYSRPI